MNRKPSNYSQFVATSIAITLLSSAIYWRWTLHDRDVLQRGFWDIFYNRCSLLYDGVDWFTFDATQKLRLRALEHIPSSTFTTPTESEIKVLEIGVGTGRLHTEIAKQKPNIQLAGIDLAPGMIEITRQRINDLNKKKDNSGHVYESDLRVGNVVEGLPWDDGTFDVVLSTFVLSAISQGQIACDEMARVAKPGGKVVIIDAGVEQNKNRNRWMSSFLAWLWEVFGDYIRDDVQLLTETRHMITVSREDYGPWGCVHITAGVKI